MPVNKDRLRKAVEALRSGEFTQGTGMLRRLHIPVREDEDGVQPIEGAEPVFQHCCLGVLTEIAVRDPEYAMSDYEVTVVESIRERRRISEDDPQTTTRDYTEHRFANLDPDDSNSIWAVENGVLSESVLRYYGLNDVNPELKVPVGGVPNKRGEGFEDVPRVVRRIAAATANDSYGWTFENIADAFEATYLQDDDATPTSD